MLELICMTGEFRGRRFRIDREASIGSAPDNDIVLEGSTISRHHARIRFADDEYLLEDLDSSNGTRIDGDLVREPERLDALNVITFAEQHDFVARRLVGQGDA